MKKRPAIRSNFLGRTGQTLLWMYFMLVWRRSGDKVMRRHSEPGKHQRVQKSNHFHHPKSHTKGVLDSVIIPFVGHQCFFHYHLHIIAHHRAHRKAAEKATVSIHSLLSHPRTPKVHPLSVAQSTEPHKMDAPMYAACTLGHSIRIRIHPLLMSILENLGESL